MMHRSAPAAVAPTRRKQARGRIWARARARVLAGLLLLALALTLPSDGHLGPARTDFIVRQAIRGQEFQLGAWEAQAIGQKLRDAVDRPGSELSPPAQHDMVIAYFTAVERIGQLSAEIERAYADSAAGTRETRVAPLQGEIAALRDEQRRRRPVVERIIEQQVGAALREADLSTAGHVWPPVRFQLTESPNYLILSPRHRIVVQKGVYLDPALPVPEMEHIEENVQQELDLSALVEGTGGFSSYPTMVLEYPVLDWVVDTVAHEWAHTYLFFQPLGSRYYESAQMRTINETIASIIGEEVSRSVVHHFYPERVRPAAWPRPLSLRPSWLGRPAEASEFEFGAFMRQTRLEVDQLLAAGQIDAAEAFMEARRRVLVDQGYAIRKLNQAYFAFHGSYAVGTAATDPIGGKLRLLRQRAGSLAAFVHTVARFKNPGDLDAALGK